MLRVSFKGLKKFADTLKPKNPEEDINVEAEIDERRMCSASNSRDSDEEEIINPVPETVTESFPSETSSSDEKTLKSPAVDTSPAKYEVPFTTNISPRALDTVPT
jgi:hypothetical protein